MATTDPRALIDDLIELPVVTSFSAIGFELRRRLWSWDGHPLPTDALVGRTVVVTGATSGIGRATAERLTTLGAHLVLVGRDPIRLDATRQALMTLRPGARPAVHHADMASLADVRVAAAGILATEPRIDVVIDNAGAILPEREETDEGIERTFAMLVAGPFLLVSRLMPRLLESPDPRVIAVTSGGMYGQRLRIDDLMWEREPWSGPRAYARAKRAQVALVRERARRGVAAGLLVNAVNPGWVDTPGLAEALPAFRDRMRSILRTPAQGSDTIVWLAASPEARRWTGRLFLDRRPRPFDRIPATRVSAAERRALWERVSALTGVAPSA